MPRTGNIEDHTPKWELKEKRKVVLLLRSMGLIPNYACLSLPVAEIKPSRRNWLTVPGFSSSQWGSQLIRCGIASHMTSSSGSRRKFINADAQPTFSILLQPRIPYWGNAPAPHINKPNQDNPPQMLRGPSPQVILDSVKVAAPSQCPWNHVALWADKCKPTSHSHVIYLHPRACWRLGLWHSEAELGRFGKVIGSWGYESDQWANS